jgi:6-phosphofructokinase 1
MKEFSDVNFIGIPGTIDNDLYGTDNCIGYDTALNTVVDAVDKIRDTAASHDRLFIVEVMGKDAGFIALRSGIAVGAEAILIPETTTYIDALIEKLKKGLRNNKMSSIIIVAEGDDSGGAYEVQKQILQHFDCFDTRVSILGHIQRGGSPSAQDRVLASRMGVAAVEALIAGRKNEMIGIVNNQIKYTPFEQSIKHHLSVNRNLLDLAEVLSH